ncbi:MAG: 5-methyltetrahydropteroyltriglutamate--homocysteine S-methyltransferase [Clostridia bacterium]|nr:5-methyltetrahydropteroyltriglutamate--homocysteine S-methyltransferase [Clostridia bacterium]
MSNVRAPQRYDFVGSFLRPQRLKDARAKFAKGEMDAAELKSVEDDAIAEVVARQKVLGYHIITDGEFRRATWHLDFMWGFKGVAHTKTATGIPFHDEPAMIDDTYLDGKVSLEGEHPFVSHYRYVKAFEDANTAAKQTMPSPAQFLEQMTFPMSMEATEKYYPLPGGGVDMDALMADIAEGYKKVIQQLYAAGCRNIQFDDCTWGCFVDPTAEFIFGRSKEELKVLEKQFVQINNMAIEGKPDDLVINTHICRGNFHSTWACQGGYDPIAELVFGGENVNAFYLEFDDARSGSFEPLKYVSGDKKVVLGLITTKSPFLEDKTAVKARIEEASKYIPLERLCLSPQCGFASCEIGNKLTEAQQWAKLRLVKEIAEEVWGK